MLKERFDNRAIIFQSHIDDLFHIKRVCPSNHVEVRNFIDTVNSHLRSLEALETNDELTKVLLFDLLRAKVDEDTLIKWDDDFSRDMLPSWESLSKYNYIYLIDAWH